MSDQVTQTVHNEPGAASHVGPKPCGKDVAPSAVIDSSIRISPDQATGAEYLVADFMRAAADYGKTRGDMLGDIFNLRIRGESTESALAVLKRCDDEFCDKLGHSRVVFTGNGEAQRELIERARIAQDTALYDELKKLFLELGIEYGEAQGRHIDPDSHSRVKSMLKQLEIHTSDVFSSPGIDAFSLPSEVAPSGSASNALVSALRAAARQGERIGIDRRISAEVDAAHVYRTIAGWKEFLPTWITLFKPFSVVHGILSGQTERQLVFINESMKERRGVGLYEALVHAYGVGREKRIRYLIEGDQVGSLAITAGQAVSSWLSTANTRGDELRAIYERVATRDIPRFERLLAGELGCTREHLPDFLRNRLSPKGSEKIDLLRHGDLAGSQVVHIADLIASGRRRQFELRRPFRKMEPEQIAELRVEYQQRYGGDLREDIARKLRPSATRDLCLAMLDNDKERTAAARIRCALHFRADFIGGPFLRKSAEERRWMVECYEKIYHPGKPNFLRDLRHAARREDFFLARIPYMGAVLEAFTTRSETSYPFLKSIIENGELAPAELLRYFMAGIGADIDGIYAVLSGCTREDIEATEADYARRYAPSGIARFLASMPIFNDLLLSGELRHDLKVELSGDHEFDILMCMEGVPDEFDDGKLCATLMNRLDRRFRHEQSGTLMRLRSGILSKLRGDGRVVKQFVEDYRTAQQYYRDHIENKPNLSAHHVKRFSTLVRLAETQADAYREAKIAMSNIVLNSGAFIGATIGAGGVIMISALPWWAGPLAAGLGSLSWRWIQGRLVLGRGFGTTDATFQAVRAFIDGASLFTIKIGVATLSGLLGQQLSSAATKGSFKTSLNRFIKSIEDGIKRQNKARYLLEKGAVMASDQQLEAITKAFYREIISSPAAIGSERLVGGSPISEMISKVLA